MRVLLQVQKYIFIIFMLVTILTFVYALGFMTDFKLLFGQINPEIMEFHDVTLQGFNRVIFRTSLISVVGFVIVMFMDIMKKIPDITLSVIVVVLAAFNMIRSLSFVAQLKEMSATFLTLDFTTMLIVGDPYVADLRTFNIGTSLYNSFIVVSILFAVICVANTVTFLLRRKA